MRPLEDNVTMDSWRKGMKRSLWTVLAALLVFSVMGCNRGYIEGYLDIVKEQGGISKEYLLVLTKWSRDQIVYSQFETRVRIAATYKSREFYEAYSKEYARIYLTPAGEAKRKADVAADLASDFTEFFFYAYIPEKIHNDFAKQNSIWTVFLEDEKGRRFYPLELRQVEKVTPVVETFYPYGNPYYGCYYTLKFPPLARPGKAVPAMKLVFVSVLGRIEFEWAGK